MLQITKRAKGKQSPERIEDCGTENRSDILGRMKVAATSLICVSLIVSGCNTTDQPATSGTYKVQSVKAGPGGSNGEAPVRIKLTTSGNVSEADLSSIVSYVKIVAKREATREQARIAQQRARAIAAKMSPSQRAQSRYIAVETSRSALDFRSQPAVFVKGEPPPSGPAPKFARSVMLWDTQRETLVGNIVYDIKDTPAVGTSAKFESISAKYVGAGS
jgi:hypothetical protein